MERRHLTCDEARALAEAMLGGGGECGTGGIGGLGFAASLSALKSHARGCPACYGRFGFDLALLETLRTLPEEPLVSVSGAVMSRLAARERRFVALRWGVVVSVVALAGATLNALGVGVFHYMSNLALHGVRSTGEFIAYNKVATILRDLVETLVLRGFGGALGADLGPYRAQIWVMAIGAAAVVLFMMYLMGLWLRQPRGVKPWHSGGMWHNGMQVW